MYTFYVPTTKRLNLGICMYVHTYDVCMYVNIYYE